MDQWKSESSPGKQLAMTLACALVGLVLAIGFRDFGVSGSNAKAGFLLGLLLLTIGLVGFLYTGKQTVVVDAKTRRITIEDSTLFHSKKRLVRFDEIDDVSIGFLGKKSNYVTCYYLVLKLKGGEDYPLFAPGRFFEGGSDRSIVEGWRQRLQRAMTS